MRNASRDDVAFADLPDANIELKTLFDQVDRTIQQFHLDFQSRVVRRQFRQGRCQAAATEAGTAADAQQPARRRLFLGQGISHQVDVFENALGPLMDDLALCGHRDAARRPVEKPFM